MSLDTRCSALTKRAEQLKRWEESDTNREPAHPKNLTGRKIKFSSGCVFLAACIAGDKDEVVRLINEGADINTANVDGLTALHQACIDDNLEMVEFLVQNKADVNRQDNEGWTPLHATASCGFNSIARYLIESGADLAAINSDGDLCIDLAASDSMEDLLQKFIEEQNIDCEAARESEKRLMLEDAKKWLRSDASEADRPHPRTGATALHVAAAKGYTKVLSLLLAGRADVDKQDNDGWTPLHAAAHWGQKEAAQMLVTSLADMDVKNYAGQTPIDIAHKDSVRFLDDLKKNNRRTKRKPIQKNNDNMGNHTDTPPKVIRVEVQTDKLTEDSKTKPPSDPMGQKSDKAIIEDEAPWRRANSLRTRTQIDSPPKNNVPEKETPPTDSEVILRRTQSFENDDKNKINNWPPNASAETTATTTTTTVTTPATTPSAAQVRRSFVPPARDEESETQRKAHAKRVRETRRSTQGVTLDEFKSAEEFVKKKNMNNNNNNTNSDNPTSSTSSSTTTTTTTNTPTTTSTEVNDRVPATNIDDAVSITATIVEQPKSDTVSASYTITAPSSDKQHQQQSYSDKTSASYTIPSSKTVSKEKSPNTDDEKSITATINVPSSNAVTKKTEEVEMSRVAGESGGNRSQKNSVSDDGGGGVISERGSRDKRSLFDIDNASSLTLAEKLRNEANKYQEVSKSNTDVSQNSAAGDVIAYRKSSDSTPPSPAHQHVATSAAERRPSWRLKFDAGNKSFKLEDATSQNAASTAAVSPPAATDSTAAPSVQRRHNYTSNPSAPVGIATQPSVAANNTAPTRPISAPVISTASSDDKLKNNNTTPVGNDVTYIRRLKNEEDKENDKENDSRTGQATQAVIQRRRRPKRRSTGVQRFDKDDLDPDRQESPGDGDDKESGSEISTRSRLGSTNSITSDLRNDDNESGENGDFIDYKALWEASKLENDKLKMQMKKKDEDLTTARATLDRFTNATTKNSLSEIEKRERRAMERKMSEMEEELKQLEPLRTENQRLKDENGALIRVISKLSK